MQWIKWSMIAAAGILPSLARAEDSPADGPFSLSAKVKVEKATTGEPRIFVVGDDDSHERKAQVEIAKGTLQHLLNTVKHEKGSYLGVSASPPPAVLRKQLGLAVGMGLVVDFVVPDSPAAKAGLQQYDVLQKLEDQLLVNQEQFSVLVRSHKPGNEVKLTIIRDGKPQTLTAKLVEHDVEPLVEGREGDREWMELRQALPEPNPNPFGPGEHKFTKEWRANVFPFPSASSSVTWLEGDRSYSITTNGEGHKTYTVKDRDGKSLFHGPIDTPEQREKLAPELKEKLEQLEHRAGATLNGGGFGPGSAINPGKKEKNGDEK